MVVIRNFYKALSRRYRKMFKTMEVLALLVAALLVILLQHLVYKQDLQAARKSSYKKGYYDGLYVNVIRHSETD